MPKNTKPQSRPKPAARRVNRKPNQRQVMVGGNNKQVRRLKTQGRKALRTVKAIAGAKFQAQDKAMIRNFLTPCDSHGFRWPLGNNSQVSATKTGSVTLYSTGQYINSAGFTGTYTGANAAAKGTQCLYLFRNPLRAAIILTTVASAATYRIHMADGSFNYTPKTGTVAEYPPWSYAAALDPTNAPHTLNLFGGGIKAAPEAQFFWLGTGDKISFLYAPGSTGTPNDYVQWQKVDQPGSVGARVANVAAPDHINSTATYYFTAPEAGYYTCEFLSAAASVTWFYTCNLVVAVGDCFSHLPIPYALEHASYLRSVRLLSSSVLVSNVASTMNVEGSIYGAVITDSTPFYEHTRTNDLSMKADHFQGSAKKGLYSWLRPSGEGVFNYRNAVTVDDGIVSDTTFQLDDGSSYQAVVIFASGISISPPSFPALDFLVSFAYTLEFESDDPWVELEFASMGCLEAQSCLELAIRAQSFSENPLHLAQIQAFVNRAGRFLRSHSNTIGTALSAMFPEYSPAIRGVSRLIQS